MGTGNPVSVPEALVATQLGVFTWARESIEPAFQDGMNSRASDRERSIEVFLF